MALPCASALTSTRRKTEFPHPKIRGHPTSDAVPTITGCPGSVPEFIEKPFFSRKRTMSSCPVPIPMLLVASVSSFFKRASSAAPLCRQTTFSRCHCRPNHPPAAAVTTRSTKSGHRKTLPNLPRSIEPAFPTGFRRPLTYLRTILLYQFPQAVFHAAEPVPACPQTR